MAKSGTVVIKAADIERMQSEKVRKAALSRQVQGETANNPRSHKSEDQPLKITINRPAEDPSPLEGSVSALNHQDRKSFELTYQLKEKNQKYALLIQSLQIKIEHLEEENRKWKSDYRQLELRIAKHEAESDRLSKPAIQSRTERPVLREDNGIVRKPSAPKSLKSISLPSGYDKKIYLASPNEAGFFLNKNAKEKYDQLKSLFVMHVNASGRDGYFSFVDEQPSIKRLLGLVSSSLRPVCEEMNILAEGAETIRLVQYGYATLEGDKWHVKSKAKIQYE